MKAHREPRAKRAKRKRKMTDTEPVRIIDTPQRQTARIDGLRALMESFFVEPHVNYVAAHRENFGDGEMFFGLDRAEVACG